MSPPRLQPIAIADIVPTKDNVRKIDERDPEFLELVESIIAGGVRVPILVRKHPKKKGKYELRAGERRCRACKAGGVATIPAMVHDKLSEADALDMTFVENKFRKALTPQEEVAEIANYMERMNGDAAAIAAKIGKPKEWVMRRAHIVKGLIPKWKKLLATERFSVWTLSHMVQLARLPEHLQQDMYDSAKRSWSGREGWTVGDLEEDISNMLKLLSKAKWNLDDETLVPAAGACSNCSNRSGHQPYLWFDSDAQADAGDQCLDPGCWDSKASGWLERRAKELKGKHPNLIFVAKDHPNAGAAELISKRVGNYLSYWQYDTATKGKPGVVPAMHVVGKGAGRLVYVKPDKSGGSSASKPSGTTPLKARRQQLDCKRWAQVLKDLQEAVEGSIIEQVTYKDKLRGVASLVAIVGNETTWCSNAKQTAKGIQELIAGKGGELATTEEALWDSVKPTLRRLLTWSGPITKTTQMEIDRGKWIATIIGLDAKAMFSEVSKRKGFAEPKSWKNLNADGTPKKTKATNKAKKPAKGKKVAKDSARTCGIPHEIECVGDCGECKPMAEKITKAKKQAGSDTKEYQAAAAKKAS